MMILSVFLFCGCASKTTKKENDLIKSKKGLQSIMSRYRKEHPKSKMPPVYLKVMQDIDDQLKDLEAEK